VLLLLSNEVSEAELRLGDGRRAPCVLRVSCFEVLVTAFQVHSWMREDAFSDVKNTDFCRVVAPSRNNTFRGNGKSSRPCVFFLLLYTAWYGTVIFIFSYVLSKTNVQSLPMLFCILLVTVFVACFESNDLSPSVLLDLRSPRCFSSSQIPVFLPNCSS
jgi:hypothetical protein